MTKQIDPLEKNSNLPHNATEDDDREYEQSGLYPPGEKPFRIVGLIATLLGVIIAIAIAAVLLDRMLIQ